MASRSESGVGFVAVADGGCPALVRASAEVGPIATSWGGGGGEEEAGKEEVRGGGEISTLAIQGGDRQRGMWESDLTWIY